MRVKYILDFDQLFSSLKPSYMEPDVDYDMVDIV